MRASWMISGIALAAFAGLALADTASPHHARMQGQVHASRVLSSVLYFPGYVPSAYSGYPRTTLAINRHAQGRTLIGVPPLVDPAVGVIDRKAWSWRRMNLGVAPAFPAYASDIRTVESPAVALDGATFVADDVIYRLRGIKDPPSDAAGAEAARLRLEDLLATGEPIVVYPLGLDFEQRMLADAVLGRSDLAALLRGR